MGETRTPRTDGLIDDMLHGAGVPRCDEWDRLKHLARTLELELTAAHSKLAAAEGRASPWIPVGERLPEIKEAYKGGPKSARVLIFNGHYVCEGRYEESFAKRIPRWKDNFDRVCKATHWQPLPPPPAASGEEKHG